MCLSILRNTTMTNLQHYSEKYPVYPGEYNPILEPGDIEEEHRKRRNIKIKEPSVNVIELTDIFKIEVAVPGVRREDFFVHVHENILSVAVVHKSGYKEGRVPKLHEFDDDFLERHIFLPPKVDAQFISAEYKEGVLHFYLPKTSQSARSISATIVVY